MRIPDLFASGSPVFSFEFFPPATPKGEETLARTISELKPLNPAFISVTYGAGGSTRDRTVELVRRIKHESGIEAMAHLTCVGASSAELDDVLNRLQKAGVENVIALRGDPPKGETTFEPHPEGLSYASELVALIRRQDRGLAVAAACYPEKHVEADSMQADIEHLARKVEAGVDFLVTQLFFENAAYFRFVEAAREAGISIPIVAGIMPVTNLAQIERFTQMCGASFPEPLREKLLPHAEDPRRVEDIGIEYAAAQCRELIEQGAPGVHFYTLNKSRATRRILEILRQDGIAPPA